MTYKFTKSNSVIRLADGASIPFDAGNTDYQKYLADVAKGAVVDPAESLAEIKARMWEKIKTERDRRKAGGVLAGTHWFHSDTDSRVQQLGLVQMGASIPAGLQWKTLSGAFVLMTPTLAGQIFQATAAKDQATFSHAEKLRADVNTSPSPETVNILAGWPLIFGE